MQDIRYTHDAGPAQWPKHVRPLSGEALKLLGIDPSNGELYYDGKRLQQHHTHSLGGFERRLAIIIAAPALAMAVVAVGRVAYRLVL